ncbi:DNAation factor subunit beta [Elysia marginata]|uniref:DNAation factor subunit beta n=1 Tax=Elysia marginata TaxID=1093978 RepID=A0AAV4GFA7_9GAST|nr:DNAation factor subunit beta [Elysia marginata]
MKAYKIQDRKRKNRFGITASSLKELINKGKTKLQIPKDEAVRLVLEDDGTEVDSDAFLKTVPLHTVFVILREGESWTGVGGLVYEALHQLTNSKHRMELASQIRELLTVDDQAPERISLMSQYLDMLDTDVDAEMRFEHEDWFDGVNKKFNSKSAVMKNSAQQRIRSYFTSAKEQIDKEKDPNVRATLRKVLDDVQARLKHADYHGQYFDRNAKGKQLRMCDAEGWFRCEGAFDETECPRHHMINPYASRGYRQMFCLWNLDHIIEKSREIVPAVIQAAQAVPKGKQLGGSELYRLLFTRENLKLVQIGCHKKAARLEHTVDPQSFYISISSGSGDGS